MSAQTAVSSSAGALELIAGNFHFWFQFSPVSQSGRRKRAIAFIQKILIPTGWFENVTESLNLFSLRRAGSVRQRRHGVLSVI
jgi:hypothetical protein